MIITKEPDGFGFIPSASQDVPSAKKLGDEAMRFQLPGHAFFGTYLGDAIFSLGLGQI